MERRKSVNKNGRTVFLLRTLILVSVFNLSRETRLRKLRIGRLEFAHQQRTSDEFEHGGRSAGINSPGNVNQLSQQENLDSAVDDHDPENGRSPVSGWSVDQLPLLPNCETVKQRQFLDLQRHPLLDSSDDDGSFSINGNGNGDEDDQIGEGAIALLKLKGKELAADQGEEEPSETENGENNILSLDAAVKWELKGNRSVRRQRKKILMDSSGESFEI